MHCAYVSVGPRPFVLETVVIIKVESHPYLSLIFMGMNFELKWYMKRRDSVSVQYVTNFVDRNTLNTSNIREKKSLTRVSLVIPAFQSKQNKVHEGKKLKNFNT